MHVGSRVRPDLTRLIEPNDIKVHVVLVNSLGESHRYSHFLRPDADLESFLKEMDQKFPMHCDPYDEWAYKDWYSSIQHLKKTGMNGDPMLYRIEGLILLHQATKNKELPQWMYYTIRDGVDGEELDIHDEESFKAMMNQAAENNAPACLIRVSCHSTIQYIRTENWSCLMCVCVPLSDYGGKVSKHLCRVEVP